MKTTYVLWNRLGFDCLNVDGKTLLRIWQNKHRLISWSSFELLSLVSMFSQLVITYWCCAVDGTGWSRWRGREYLNGRFHSNSSRFPWYCQQASGNGYIYFVCVSYYSRLWMLSYSEQKNLHRASLIELLVTCNYMTGVSLIGNKGICWNDKIACFRSCFFINHNGYNLPESPSLGALIIMFWTRYSVTKMADNSNREIARILVFHKSLHNKTADTLPKSNIIKVYLSHQIAQMLE